MKRIPAVLLALAVIFLLGGAALAEGDTYSASHGVVTQVDTEAQTMTIRLGGREEGTLTLDISEETKIVDNASRTACKLSDIKAGSTVYVWHTAGQSSFLPPHRKAYAIVPPTKRQASFLRLHLFPREKTAILCSMRKATFT